MEKVALGCALVALSLGCYEVSEMEEPTMEPESETQIQDTIPQECPSNSGYPCTCSMPVCDSGETCLVVGDPGDPGMCGRTCTRFGSPDDVCASSFGVAVSGVVAGGLCALQVDSAKYCVVLCGYNNLARGDCPPGTQCTAIEGTGGSVCLP